MGRTCLFFNAKVSQDSIKGLPRFIGHNVLVFDTRYDPDSSTAAAADFYVDVENALEPLGPTHRGVTLSCRSFLGLASMLDTFSAFGWRDQSAPSVVGG